MSQTSQQFALISIHASAKEATFPLYLLWMGKRFQSTPPRRRRRKPVRCRKPMHCHFNPRLREGGDLASYANTLVISGFQSTPPRRRRQWLVVYTDTSKEFQSTPPRRRRPQLAASQASQNISIHASAKEATKSTTATTAAKKISIHASAKEATVYNGTIDWKKVKFQSTPPRRRRLKERKP